MSEPSLQLHWRIGPATSCWHAVRALVRGAALCEPKLAAALALPVERLVQAFAEEKIPGQVFLDHLLALTTTLDSPQRGVEVALTKTIGQSEGPFRLPRILALAEEIRRTYSQNVPDLARTLPPALEQLVQRWNYRGPGLLGGVLNWTAPDVLVEQAQIVVVHPAVGGAGSAHLSYNLACIEAVTADLVPQLPEVLRVAWLVSTLNLDLPRYSEQLTHTRIATVAHLAMIPVVLIAAEALDLLRCDELTLRHAVATWWGPGPDLARQTDVVVQWWEVYRTMRPRWATALQALDRMLAGEETANGPLPH